MISHACTRLKRGDIIEMPSGEYHVIMVNECRARCIPTERVKVKREMFDKRTGETKEVEFSHAASGINISPNSECKIIGFKPVEMAATPAPTPVTKAKVTTAKLNKALKKLKRAA